jgi:hypothetical protein
MYMPPEKPPSPPETHQEMALNVSMSQAQAAQILRYASDAVLSLALFSFLTFLFFLYSSGTVSLSAEAPANVNTVTVDSDNGGKQTGDHCDD